jgi:hypothetical protein
MNLILRIKIFIRVDCIDLKLLPKLKSLHDLSQPPLIDKNQGVPDIFITLPSDPILLDGLTKI